MRCPSFRTSYGHARPARIATCIYRYRKISSEEDLDRVLRAIKEPTLFCAPYRDLNDAKEDMARTKSFKDLVQSHVKRDKTFAAALLREGIDAMLSGDVETGKTILRDYIKATVGFEKLGKATDTPPKSLIRMFGPRGNPQAKNLFSVIGYLQKRAGVRLRVAA